MSVPPPVLGPELQPSNGDHQTTIHTKLHGVRACFPFISISPKELSIFSLMHPLLLKDSMTVYSQSLDAQNLARCCFSGRGFSLCFSPRKTVSMIHLEGARSTTPTFS